ncbi:MAG TPA: DUF3365 domain-containing protein [Nitrospira sp.]|nr:DUF3365 domain-containing protein [Nitrospira sp.]
MNTRGFGYGFTLGAAFAFSLSPFVLSAANKGSYAPRLIPAERVAEYVHAVIQADRSIYTTEVVERMKNQGIVTASENWRDTGKLPLPVQFLIEASQLMASNPNGIRFRLISNWAINKKNVPRTDFEKTGLLEVAVSPERAYKGMKQEHGIEYFEALYPDIAVSQSCVRCHNAHPQSPKKDFRVGDVMGGLLVSIPVSR